jgi:2-dehydropantoate 2-reductase
MDQPHIVVQGAGLIGGYLGGVLAHAGARITLLGRAHVIDPLKQGLKMTDLEGRTLHVPTGDIRRTTEPACLAEADIVLTCVKSGATAGAAAELAQYAEPGTVVVSFQNGVGNADILRQGAPSCDIVAGMVPFNVMQPAPTHWHRGTAGALFAGRHAALTGLVPQFAAAGIALKFSDDMPGVQWAKILLNLNNAVNALSDLPLKAELSDRNYRLVLAACISEALTALKADNIPLQQINRTPPQKLPSILRWPDFLYQNIAMRQLKMDNKARGSMLEDLALARKTEIDDINGAVVRLAEKNGIPTPVNRKIIELIRTAESGDATRFSGKDLRAAVGV